LEIIKLLLHHFNLFQIIRNILNSGMLLLGSDPVWELLSFTHKLISLASFFQSFPPLRSQLNEVIVQFLNLGFSGTNRWTVDQLLLWSSQARINLLYISCRNKSLSVIHLNFPPIFVIWVQKSQNISFLHGNLSRRFLSVIIESHDTLLSKHVNDRSFLLTTSSSHLLQILDGVSKCFKVRHESIMLFEKSFTGIFIFSIISISSKWLLLFHPRLSFACISKVLVSLERIIEILFPLVSFLFQLVPVVMKSAQAVLDVIRCKVSILHHVLSCPWYGINSWLVIVNFRHGSLVLLNQVLDTN